MANMRLVKVLILGCDGYIGFPLCLRLLNSGHEVFGLDDFSRRMNVKEMDSWSILPILSPADRKAKLEQIGKYQFLICDISRIYADNLKIALRDFRPDVIIHLAEQPSAPFSMIDRKHAINTMRNNVIGTMNLIYAIKEHAPQAHLIKLGTLGEYGTPEIEIPEGFLEIEHKGKKVKLPFPKQAGSWYHWTKVHDSNNIMFASKLWGLTSTDIMQGIVYGTKTKELQEWQYNTRFDIDEAFGTVINRFCAQAVIGYPLTVYGEGGQTRGFLSLADSIQCIELLMNNPPEKGEYRVVNQFDEKHSVLELAEKIKKIGDKKGLDVKIRHIENPRIEKEEHRYLVNHDTLLKLGFKHTRMIDDEINIMLDDLIHEKERIQKKKHVIFKGIKWRS